MKRCVACGQSFQASGWRCPACGFEPAERNGILCFAPDAIDEGRGFDPAAFEHLVRREDASFWFRGRNKLINWALERHFPTARSLLEVGCGTGYVLAGLQRAHTELVLVGAELYPHGLRYARERVPGAEFVQLDATNIPYDGEWDVVGAFDVLEHVENDETAIAGLALATRRGGGVIVTVPQHPSLWSAADDYARHVRRYTRGELVAKLRGAGLEIRRVTSFVSILLPAMYLSRLWERRTGNSFDPEREHAVAARVRPLERILDVERLAIRHGVSLPAGGSLMAVAQRP